MDYIYKDLENQKCVGEIESLEVTPYYQFIIRTNDRNLYCHMEHMLIEWRVHFIDIGKSIEIAHPSDVLWNSEALYEVFKDAEMGTMVAYAIKKVYEKYNYEDVSF